MKFLASCSAKIAINKVRVTPRYSLEMVGALFTNVDWAGVNTQCICIYNLEDPSFPSSPSFSPYSAMIDFVITALPDRSLIHTHPPTLVVQW